MCENCIAPLKKVILSFPATLSKRWGPTTPPPFWKFVWKFNPPASRNGGGGAHYVQALEINCKLEQKLRFCQAPSFWKLGWKFNLSPSRKGGVQTICKPLTLTANRNKKSARCHNESWRHNFLNPRFSGMRSKLIKKKIPFLEKFWTHYI